MMRIGHGYDIHRLVEGRSLILGGVVIPHDRGLLGHSDADAVLHAIADSFLGACALGDIGEFFPDTDDEFEGANSADLLTTVMGAIRDAGFRPGNLDINIICEAPKLMPYKAAMRQRIAELTELDLNAVSLKARTSEGLGPVGTGEAIEVHCVSLLTSIT
jgi:2-C-methyl-D-erythritol 2,4-cyclodiphosphate synthase